MTYDRAMLRRGVRIGVIFVIVAAVLVTGILVVYLNFFSTSETGVEETSDSTTEAAVSDNYEYNEEVLEEIDAASSSNIPTVAELVAELEERGFSNYQISADYDISGEYISEEITDTTSTERYPLYTIFYMAQSGYWTIYVSNGEWMAYPIFTYDFSSGTTIVTENDYIVAYDADSNTFIESIPDESEAILKVVDCIDAETIDSLDEDALANL